MLEMLIELKSTVNREDLCMLADFALSDPAWRKSPGSRLCIETRINFAGMGRLHRKDVNVPGEEALRRRFVLIRPASDTQAASQCYDCQQFQPHCVYAFILSKGNEMDFDYVVMPAVILPVALLLVALCIRRMHSLSAKGFSYPAWRKVSERIVLSLLLLLAILAGGSSSFNAIKLYRFRGTNTPPGALYIVDGRKMHINCTGSGSPTLVLEAGSGGDGLVWGGVQPVLSKTTRVCSYDRAGLGWSEPRPGPRDADHIASELHALPGPTHINVH